MEKKIIDLGAGYKTEIEFVFGNFRVRDYDNEGNPRSECFISYDVGSAIAEMLVDQPE